MRLVRLALLLIPVLLMLGCGVSSSPTAPSAFTGLALQGGVHGGEPPVVGAHVYLFAANTTGNAGNGIAASSSNASVSLLNSSSTGLSDSIGAYVLTDSTGSFSITGDYTCTSGQQVYLYALGGNPGAGTNTASGFLAALGNCPVAGNFAGTVPYIWMSEVSTVAAAYAFAGYATDATHVSSSGSALALTGIANAFLNAANLVNMATGVALTTTPAGNATVPQTNINTLANILAACVNSSGSSSSSCTTLLSTATSDGTSNGAVPTDTATAAINIAHDPGVNLATLYPLQASNTSFSPHLTAQPNDFTVALNFTGSGVSGNPYAIAIDGSGNAWTANVAGNKVSKLIAGTGAVASGAPFIGIPGPGSIAIDASGNVWTPGFNGNGMSILTASGTPITNSPFSNPTNANLNQPSGIAFDTSGNAWVSNYSGNYLSKITRSGNSLTATSYYNAGLSNPYSNIAVDTSGNIWVPSYSATHVLEFTSAGTAATGSPFTGGGMGQPVAAAIDGSGNVWIANNSGGGLTALSGAGTPLSSTGYTGGGLNHPQSIAIDGAGTIWLANYNGSSVSAFSNAGVALSPSTGFSLPTNAFPRGIAVDPSGNVWTANYGLSTVTEFIGAAAPVVTPLIANLLSPYSHPASRP
jgi:streptogramin lyase